ncbi:cytidylyltransferase domain-containing protein [Ideonella alba]|uniref:Glycosyltransferase family protein n=1 Tax=Ideonella alba TaxID=2824118 RepID=A0A940Y4I2_9BURK|nr:glycosyltransferase family protein [Ideonella alba]MBQ0929632.1 glycosyltransferase family protein [Ideonella alba]
MTTVAIIQARMSSSRLPGKVLKPLLGLPSIVFMAQRVRQARCVDRLIVATSVDASDDPLAEVLAAHGIECFRGPLADVLARFHQAASHAGADVVLRLTGDCPLIDPELIDRVAALVIEGSAAYATNAVPASFPDGLDVEAMRIEALAAAAAEATLPSDREHVTPFIRREVQRFPARSISAFADLSSMRWTVDHPDDLAHVEALLAAVGATSPTGFDRFDLYRAIERHGVQRGQDHQRNEGYLKSLRDDAAA